MQWGLTLPAVLVLLVTNAALAADDPRDAELRVLRDTVTRQAQTIRDLRAKVTPPAATAPALAQPLAAPARKVVYVLDGTAIGSVSRRELGRSELIRALQALRPIDNYAFVIVGQGDERITLTPATAGNITQTLSNLPTEIPSTINAGNPFDVLTRAVNADPHVIWYVGSGRMIRAKHASQIGKMAGDRGVKINTTTAFTDGSPDTAAYVWTLANASGGKCVDKHGVSVTRPAAAIDPEQIAPVTKADNTPPDRDLPPTAPITTPPQTPSTNPTSIFDF